MTEPVLVAVIPAGGLGTRFLPVTKTVPKEMLPLVDVPIVDVVVSEAVDAGIAEVVVVSAPGKWPLDAYFEAAPALEERLRAEQRDTELALARRGEGFGRVRVIHQERPLGNGHAVLCARELVGRRPFLMIWGDDIVMGEPSVAKQLIATRERLGGGTVAAAMRVARRDPPRYGMIEGEKLDDRTWRVRGIVEKPEPRRTPSDLAAVHAYVFEPEIFDALAALRPGRGGELWLTDAVNELAQRAAVYALRFEGERFDTGERGQYVRAVVAAALARPELADDLRAWLRRRLDEESRRN